MKSNCILVPEDKINQKDYPVQFTSCLIVNESGEIFIQKRPDDWWTYPGFLSLFGGKCESGETPWQTIIRELKEEVNLDIDKTRLHYLGSITEPVSKHKDLVHQFFYHLKDELLIDCFEAELRVFENANTLLNESKIMDDVIWNVGCCISRGLIKK